MNHPFSILTILVMGFMLLFATASAQGQQPAQASGLTLATIAALLIGIVIGYLAHWLLRRIREPKPADLAALAGLFGGGAVVQAFSGEDQIWWYMIGVFIGFSAYLAALWIGRESLQAYRSEETSRPLPLFPFIKSQKK